MSDYIPAEIKQMAYQLYSEGWRLLSERGRRAQTGFSIFYLRFKAAPFDPTKRLREIADEFAQTMHVYVDSTTALNLARALRALSTQTR